MMDYIATNWLGLLLVAVSFPPATRYVYQEIKSDYKWHRIVAANREAWDDVERRGSRERHPTGRRHW